MSFTLIPSSERKHRVKVGKTSIQATTWVEWDYETESVRGSVAWDDDEAEEAYYRRFDDGDLINLVVRVVATWQDAEGSDYLGGCHVVASKLGDEVLSTAEDHGMRMEALKQLQERVVSRAKLYKFKGI